MKIVNAECIALDVPFYADHGTRRYGDGHREWRFTDENVYQFAFYKGNFPAFRRGSI